MKKFYCRINTKYVLLPVIIIISWLIFSILLLIYDSVLSFLVCSIVTLLFVLVFIIDVFCLQTITIHEDKFITNFLIVTDVNEYQNKLFKKVIIEYKDIKRIEERTINNKKRIYLYTNDDVLVVIHVEHHFNEIFEHVKRNLINL